MTASPIGWQSTRLELAAETFSGGTPLRNNPRFFGGGIPWVKSGEVNDRRVLSTEETISEAALASSSAKVAPKGSVLVAMYGATAGKVALLEIDAAINQAILAVVPKCDIAHGRFLFHALEFDTPKILRKVQGSGQPNLSGSILRGHELALPPLGEQRKIAAILSSVDDTIEATQAVIDQLQVVKKAMMAELLTRGLPGRHTKFKMTEIGEVPEAWTTATYAELAADLPGAIQSGPFGSALKHSEFVDDGYLVIGIDNVLDGQFVVGSNHRITPEKFDELRRFEARPNDLLITIMATIGRCCVVPENIERAIITKHIYRLTVDADRANPSFLMYCLYGLQRLADEVRGSAQGLTRPGLNKSLLLPLRFPLPPVHEQGEIVGAMQAVDRRIEAERQSLAGLLPIKSALMSVLLTGEVRVKVTD
jgi:type I restriction enzyme S subunit